MLIVSHDRDFLDQTVNKILFFDNNGLCSFFLGGYSDFLKTQNNNFQNKLKKTNNQKKKDIKFKKLSFKYQYELTQLPKEIDLIIHELEKITKELKEINFDIENYKRYVEVTEKMENLNKELKIKEDRWLEVLEIEENIKNSN